MQVNKIRQRIIYVKYVFLNDEISFGFRNLFRQRALGYTTQWMTGRLQALDIGFDEFFSEVV